MEVVKMTSNTPEAPGIGLTHSFKDDDIQYWIYELWMTEAKKKKVEEDAARCGIDPERYLTKLLECALDDEEKVGEANKSAHAGTDRGICLVRYYPVLKGENEAQALERAKAEETKGRRREWGST